VPLAYASPKQGPHRLQLFYWSWCHCLHGVTVVITWALSGGKTYHEQRENPGQQPGDVQQLSLAALAENKRAFIALPDGIDALKCH